MVKKLTKDQEQEIVELFDDGHGFKVPEIAEAYGRSVVTIVNTINRGRWGVNGPRQDRPTGGADSPTPTAG